MTPMRGTYPGGPRRRDQGEDAEEGRAHPPLRAAEDFEDHLHERQRRAVHRRRRRRFVVGFALAVLVAGVVGFWMGFQGNRTSEEIAAEQGRAPEQGFDLGRERNLILEQLWLMEDLERARQP